MKIKNHIHKIVKSGDGTRYCCICSRKMPTKPSFMQPTEQNNEKDKGEIK